MRFLALMTDITPSPVISGLPRHDNSPNANDREDIELSNISSGPAPTASEADVDERHLESTLQRRRTDQKPSILAQWWRKHIAPDVSHEQCRDFYALERTFLSYIRTANALASLGVVIAQLFRLPSTVNGVDSPLVSLFFRLGRPLGAATEGLAIVIVLVGALRCWRQQQRILGGTVMGGGWEIWLVGGGALALLVVLLTLSLEDTATGKAV
ncbi:Hypothetical protein R9X50_00688800 [Acrodontium crateriforme]|uniref:DUF202 domain-containing protein n=1 Tax=Acrodontium crateriforme TaxID=150365 RepID=A0AAQ3RAB7_9PEZI|nr:Hypothetical protein R9X50_00688800 [Acrodontium crateriforme]